MNGSDMRFESDVVMKVVLAINNVAYMNGCL
jgi:hypothetical protein